MTFLCSHFTSIASRGSCSYQTSHMQEVTFSEPCLPCPHSIEFLICYDVITQAEQTKRCKLLYIIAYSFCMFLSLIRCLKAGHSNWYLRYLCLISVFEKHLENVIPPMSAEVALKDIWRLLIHCETLKFIKHQSSCQFLFERSWIFADLCLTASKNESKARSCLQLEANFSVL